MDSKEYAQMRKLKGELFKERQERKKLEKELTKVQSELRWLKRKVEKDKKNDGGPASQQYSRTSADGNTIKDYNSQTVDQLKWDLKGRGIRLTNLTRKQQIIDRLIEDDKKMGERNGTRKEPGQPKRKCGAEEGRSTSKKRGNIFDNTKEEVRWESQYYQGEDTTKFRGLGSGWSLLGTPFVPSQSPIDGKMRFEIMSGTDGVGSGGIRVCGLDHYWPNKPEFRQQPIFMMPFEHVEQVIVLRNPSPSAPKSKAYQVIIIPTAATGASPIVRQRPEIISFFWADQKPDSHLQGRAGESSRSEKETYLSVFKRVFNEQLSAFGKSVISVAERGDDEHVFECSTTAEFMKKGETEYSKILGQLYFLDMGLLFSSKPVKLYLPFESVMDTTSVVALDYAVSSKKPSQGAKRVAMELHFKVYEPYYRNKDASDSGTQDSRRDLVLLSFKKMPVKLFDEVKAYMSKHNITVDECEQKWYDYSKNQMMSGWNPIGGKLHLY